MLFLLGLCVCEVTSSRDTNDLREPASCVRRKLFPGREGAAAQVLADSGAAIMFTRSNKRPLSCSSEERVLAADQRGS